MPAFKMPNFQERQQSAARARTAALELYRNRPPVDEATTAERVARRHAREAAEAEKRTAALRAREAAADAKREKEREAAEAAAREHAEAEKAAAQAKFDGKARRVEERENWTDDDRKAARDARYAARKARQQRR